MSQDKYGNSLKVGDAVLLRGTVKAIIASTGLQNVEVELIEPDGSIMLLSERLEKILGVGPGDYPTSIIIIGPTKEKT